MNITYYPQATIDKQKWDRCIDTAENGAVYAYSFYLDAMAAHWDALVWNDYEIVMPLTWNKKYTFFYLFQPFFCAQLGVFGNHLTADIVRSFLENIPSKFKYWDFYLNRHNLYALEGFPMYERINYVLDLHRTYEEMARHYADSHLRNMKRAIKQGNTVKRNISVRQIIALAREQAKYFSPVTSADFEHFTSVLDLLQRQDRAVTYGVYAANGQLTASCAFIFSHHRAYYILVGNHPDGRTSGASHLMVDEFIRDHAGQDLLLDFEGSNIRTLAFFYERFGAEVEKYPGIKRNKLPPLVKLFRK